MPLLCLNIKQCLYLKYGNFDIHNNSHLFTFSLLLLQFLITVKLINCHYDVKHAAHAGRQCLVRIGTQPPGLASRQPPRSWRDRGPRARPSVPCTSPARPRPPASRTARLKVSNLVARFSC